MNFNILVEGDGLPEHNLESRKVAESPKTLKKHSWTASMQKPRNYLNQFGLNSVLCSAFHSDKGRKRKRFRNYIVYFA